MLKSHSLALFVMFSLIAGCQQQEPKPQMDVANQANDINKISPTPNPRKKISMKDSITLSYTGTVQYFDLEGGFYGIVTDKGEKLLPMNLDKKYLKPGTIISFSGRHEKNRMTIQQWGKVFRIEKVTLVKAGKNTINPTH